MYCSNCGATLDGAFCARCGSPAAAPAQPAVPAPAVLPIWNYASWGIRVVGYLIDGLIIVVATAPFWLLGVVFGAFSGWRPAREGAELLMVLMFSMLGIVSLLVTAANKVWLVSSRGHSVGQKVVGIKVVDARGNRITMGAAVLRVVAHLGINLVPLGFLLDLAWPLWDSRRQTLHDKAAGSYVIHKS